MHKHPCIDFNVNCPFYDAKKKICYGVKPAFDISYVEECPKLDIARIVYAKQQKKEEKNER